MFYYKYNGNIIESVVETDNEAFAETMLQKGFIATEDKLIIKADNTIAFEKDVDMQAEAEAKAKQEHNAEVNQGIYFFKQKLEQTDYVCSKLIEGVATKEEYADILALRQTWRAKINELEQQIEQ